MNIVFVRAVSTIVVFDKFKKSFFVSCLQLNLFFLQIIFVENKNTRATLLGDIDESQLPYIYGGKLPLVPING